MPVTSLPMERVRLLNKLESIGDLSEPEKLALCDLPLEVQELGDGQDIVREGDRPSRCSLLLSGFACRYTLLRDGKRQIFSFHPPGDIPDLQSLYLGTMDHSLGTLAHSRIAYIKHDDIRKLIGGLPHIAELFWRDTLIEAAIYREWMTGLGRRNAHQRIAHVLCEMALRFKAVGLSRDHAYPMPVSQAELADATGLTLVHVNRVLKELRTDRLVVMAARTVSILDWQRFSALADFDPTFLHQQ
jgi:CRP-like cAMP-binding protein